MKKLLLYVIAVTLFMTGCTSKEQDEQINSFWQQQLSNVFSGRLGMRPPENPNMVPERLLLDAEGKPLFPQEETSQEQPSEQSSQAVDDPESTQQAETAQAPTEETSATQAPTALSKQTSVKAILFIHSDSPQAKQLKEDQWDKTFLQKYQGRVSLVEYDMKDPASKQPLQEMMRKHKLASITVPILFIGNQHFQGYPFGDTDTAMQKALSGEQNKPQSVQKRKQQSNQYMEIIMEDAPKTRKTTSRASSSDSRAIQLALANVEKNNQATLADMGSFFGEDTKAQAYAIISRTERLLRKKASSSPDYKTYLATQKSLLQIQEKELNELMRQNAKNLRSVRG